MFQLDKNYTDKENKVEIVKKEILELITIELYDEEKKKQETEREIFCPEYLKEEIEKLILCWIDSAIKIFYYMKENKYYIINEKGEINPVDYLNTSIFHRNMMYENGKNKILHILNT